MNDQKPSAKKTPSQLLLRCAKTMKPEVPALGTSRSGRWSLAGSDYVNVDDLVLN